jgi:hypothetical protein
MSATNSQPSLQPAGGRLTTPPQGDLRPDLAAFFIRTSREPPPRCIGHELGVLAELRVRSGYN